MRSAPGAGTPGLDFELVAETAVPPGVDARRLEDLTAFVLAAEGAAGAWQVTVALVDDARLQVLHRDYMASDSPTDIMTFPRDEGDGGTRGGDLVISVDHALARAAEWDLTPAEEIEFLVAHGLLHLLGWRDEDDVQRQRMLERQHELIERWKQE